MNPKKKPGRKRRQQRHHARGRGEITSHSKASLPPGGCKLVRKKSLLEKPFSWYVRRPSKTFLWNLRRPTRTFFMEKLDIPERPFSWNLRRPVSLFTSVPLCLSSSFPRILFSWENYFFMERRTPQLDLFPWKNWTPQ